MALTPKQEQFCQEYIVDLNATQAAIRAGYSEKTADKIGSQLLGKTRVAERVQELQTQRAQTLQVTQEMVVSELAKLGFSNMYDFVSIQDDGTARVDLSALTREQAAAITEVQTEEQTVLGGDDESFRVRKIKFKLADKKGALELLGKHLGMFTDKVQHSGGLSIVWEDPKPADGEK